MSNRQVRREQARSSRSQRGTRSGRPPAGRGPSRPSTGPGLLSRQYLVIVTLVVVLAAAVLVWVVSQRGSSKDELTTKLEAAHAAFPFELAKGTRVGRDDAPLKLQEYEDVQCPFCLKYTANQEPTLVAEYVKTGKVQIEYLNLAILGTESLRGALALQCAADQNKFWDYHSKLFTVQAKAGQATIEKKDVGRFSDANLKQFAGELGLDQAKFDDCFTTDKYLDQVRTQSSQARSLGLNGTPSFVISGQPIGSAPDSLDGWRKLLDSAYAQVTGATTPAAGSASPAASAAASASPSPGASPTPTAAKTP